LSHVLLIKSEFGLHKATDVFGDIELIRKKLSISDEWIWGNDLETIAFAQAFGHQKILIFRFGLDNTQ
jgi:hypothetical protein